MDKTELWKTQQSSEPSKEPPVWCPICGSVITYSYEMRDGKPVRMSGLCTMCGNKEEEE